MSWHSTAERNSFSGGLSSLPGPSCAPPQCRSRRVIGKKVPQTFLMRTHILPSFSRGSLNGQRTPALCAAHASGHFFSSPVLLFMEEQCASFFSGGPASSPPQCIFFASPPGTMATRVFIFGPSPFAPPFASQRSRDSRVRRFFHSPRIKGPPSAGLRGRTRISLTRGPGS